MDSAPERRNHDVDPWLELEWLRQRVDNARARAEIAAVSARVAVDRGQHLLANSQRRIQRQRQRWESETRTSSSGRTAAREDNRHSRER